MKPGDIVRTPKGSPVYGGLPAIVERVEGAAAYVHTGKFELSYEQAQLAHLATIEVTKRTYRTPGGNRFRVCFLHVAGATQAQENHVLVGAKGEAAETRVLEVRRRLFLRLVASLS